MIDREHGLHAVITACGLAVITAAVLYASNAEKVPGAASQAEPAQQHETAFVDRDVSVFRAGPTDETITLRFYEDLPDIAYVKLEDYHHLFFPDAEVTVTEEPGEESAVFSVTNENGSALINTKNETIRSEDFLAFTNIMGLVQPGMPGGYLDGLPYVRWSRREAEPAQAPVELDLAGYGIDLRADEGELCLPIATLSDLYADLAYHFAFYDGTKVYVEDENRLPAFSARDDAYCGNAFAEDTRPADLAAFTYGELCFAIDHFYGQPARTAVSGAIAEKGLDQTLDDLGEAGTKLRKMLLSREKAEYLAGMECIGELLSDGGHTIIAPGRDIQDSMPPAMHDKYNAYRDAADELLPELMKKSRQDLFSVANNKMVRESLRAQAFGEGTTYFKKGDTAVCVFNSFLSQDVKSFEPYLRGETGQMPENDPMTLFMEALGRAKADPEVQNFVVDLTANGGGSLDMVMALQAMLTGKNEGYLTYRNLLTGQTITDHYEVDVNMDGSFDEADSVPCGLNIAILTSADSFSCANLFPAIMKDEGFLVLGEQSGGGSCAIQCMATADGFWYQISSSRMQLLSRATDNLDAGVPVDVELVDGNAEPITTPLFGFHMKEDGTVELGEFAWKSIDYSGLYNLDRISEEMHAYYEKPGDYENPRDEDEPPAPAA